MTPAQFRAALKALGWSQAEAARQMQAKYRTVRGWAAGRSPVPGPVQVLLAERIKATTGTPT